VALIVLHSAHFARIFNRLIGTPCNLRWRDAGERACLSITNPAHPIETDLPTSVMLEDEEMRGEPFAVPKPPETIFLSWFQGGKIFRSGLTYCPSVGHIFYFRPGYEIHPTDHDKMIQQILATGLHAARKRRRMSLIDEQQRQRPKQRHYSRERLGQSIHSAVSSAYHRCFLNRLIIQANVLVIQADICPKGLTTDNQDLR